VVTGFICGHVELLLSITVGITTVIVVLILRTLVYEGSADAQISLVTYSLVMASSFVYSKLTKSLLALHTIVANPGYFFKKGLKKLGFFSEPKGDHNRVKRGKTYYKRRL